MRVARLSRSRRPGGPGGHAGGAGVTLVFCAVLAVIVALISGCGSETAEDSAPDFAGTTLDGTNVSLSEYRGKPLVLAFMASW